jgi:ComF family protein
MPTPLITLRRAGSLLLDAAIPPTCAGCGREGDALCPSCSAPFREGLARRVGVPIGLPSDVPAPLLQLEWCAPFDGPVRAAVHALKYAGERRLAEVLGAAVAERWRVAGAGGDVLVPVPVHAHRARERGFDQAVLIAEAAAARLGLPCGSVLVRHRATVAQFHLDRPERAGNVAGAFALAPDAPLRALEGRWPILVDDVATTGSTLGACARVLLDAGAIGVSAVTVARER